MIWLLLVVPFYLAIGFGLVWLAAWDTGKVSSVPASLGFVAIWPLCMAWLFIEVVIEDAALRGRMKGKRK